MIFVIASMITAIAQGRRDCAKVTAKTGAKAQGQSMSELALMQLRQICGSDDSLVQGPHGTWGLPSSNS